MATFSNQVLITKIMNGEEEILFYLSGKYYQTARRWLRRHGCPDKETPHIFSVVLLEVTREIQQSKLSSTLDFEQYFFNSLRAYYKNLKTEKVPDSFSESMNERELAAACFSILDESARKILSARYIGKLSFEQIAVKFDYSNPVIAQFEVNRAFKQYENITRARLNVTQN